MTYDDRVYEELSIVIGVPKAPADSNTAEEDLIVLNLMSGGAGFTVANDLSGWNPAIAQSKAGVWADTATFDGRTPQALPVQNVVETMNITCLAGSWQEVNQFYNDLMRFIRRSREFWTVQSQIEPVYLKWRAVGASGSQYALIYNINAAPVRTSTEINETTVMYDAVLTIEREPAWRWEVAPGENPKKWSLRNTIPADVNTYNLVSALALSLPNYHIAQKTFENKHEYEVGTDYSTIRTTNYIDVLAADIPGDAPALAIVTVGPTSGLVGTTNISRVYTGVKTNNLTKTSIDGNTVHLANTLNASDLITGGSLVTDATRGIYGIGTGVAGYYYRTIAPAAGGGTASLTWNPDVAQTVGGNLDMNMLRGSWMVFVRNRFTSGAQGDIDIALAFSEYADTAFNLPTLTLTGEAHFQAVAGIGNIADWGLTYMGQITLPISRKALTRYAIEMTFGVPNPVPAAYNSSGLHIGNATNVSLPSGDGTLQVVLTATNNSGGARTLAIGDIVLMPVDEYAAAVVDDIGSPLVFDTTSYSAHGDPLPSAIWGGTQSNELVSTELRGSGLFLKPGVDNRIFVLVAFDVSGAGIDISPTRDGGSITAYVNIVPRSYGARDQ